ncbi:nucleotide-binding protein [Cyanobium sp. FGCU-6]|nr:nucleotide-binding protein [Cyanobium sp. FGCU6]
MTNTNSSNTIQANEQKSFYEFLYDFVCMARNRKAALVIRYFLEIIIKRSPLCETGSILVLASDQNASSKEMNTLLVWTDKDDVNSLEELRKENRNLPIDDGIAAMAFRKRAPEYAPLCEKHPSFKYSTDSTGKRKPTDIGPIYCVPIMLSDCGGEPFGVAAFQNTKKYAEDHKNLFNEEDRLKMRLAVKTLEAMLLCSPRKLVDFKQVFIVHGRREKIREELVKFLGEMGIGSVVIQAKARTGGDLLSTIEDQINSCMAGFILLTPDDEGRLYEYGQQPRLRARQNVIFEAGFLTALFRKTRRVCFVKEGDLEIPSDLNGLLMETYTGNLDEERIRSVLVMWGMLAEEDKLQRQIAKQALAAPPKAADDHGNGALTSITTAAVPGAAGIRENHQTAPTQASGAQQQGEPEHSSEPGGTS